MNTTECENFAIGEFRSGNVPDFLRKLVPVTWSDVTTQPKAVTIFVTPDYVSLGSDSDFMRIPVGARNAQAMADQTDCILPTRKIVNEIYRAAKVKLAPHPFDPRVYKIDTPDIFWQSQVAIQEAFNAAGAKPGELVAGIKKDIVITPGLTQRPKQVAIYGWHKLDGIPIQPLTLVHVNWYRDYSHGVRLVSKTMLINGETTETASVLSDPVWYGILSDEGPTPAHYPAK